MNGVPVITAPVAMRATSVTDEPEGEWSPLTRFVKSQSGADGSAMETMRKPFYRIAECCGSPDHAESLAVHNLQGFVLWRAGLLIMTGWCDRPFWSFSHLPCLPIGQEEPESAPSVSAFLHVN